MKLCKAEEIPHVTGEFESFVAGTDGLLVDGLLSLLSNEQELEKALETAKKLLGRKPCKLILKNKENWG